MVLLNMFFIEKLYNKNELKIIQVQLHAAPCKLRVRLQSKFYMNFSFSCKILIETLPKELTSRCAEHDPASTKKCVNLVKILHKNLVKGPKMPSPTRL
jgi:hypothetical protein